jgi:hypothetical protein
VGVPDLRGEEFEEAIGAARAAATRAGAWEANDGGELVHRMTLFQSISYPAASNSRASVCFRGIMAQTPSEKVTARTHLPGVKEIRTVTTLRGKRAEILASIALYALRKPAQTWRTSRRA